MIVSQPMGIAKVEAFNTPTEYKLAEALRRCKKQKLSATRAFLSYFFISIISLSYIVWDKI